MPGIQILMSAKLALEMGCPIFSIVGLVNTATDKEGRSVPAPGQGILTTAREIRQKFTHPMLDVTYRQKRMNRDITQMNANLMEEKKIYEMEAKEMTTKGTKEEKEDGK